MNYSPDVSESEEKEQREGAATADPEGQAVSKEDASPGGCPVRMHDGETCERPIHPAPAHDPVPVCLMHSYDPQKSDAAFKKEFEAILKAAEYGIADCTRFVFPSGDYGKQEFKAACVFRGATFSQGGYFRDARFRQKADFNEASFTQDAKFIRATFEQYADFYGATFTQDADFRMATFTQDANFYGATFTRDAKFFRATFTQAAFSRATFEQKADFSRATFTQGAYFPEARFAQKANFSEATFGQNADFSLATFTQDALFEGAMFTQSAEFSNATFTQDAKFFDAKFSGDADFIEATFTQMADFRKTKFLGRVEFRSTKFRGHDKDKEERSQEVLPGPAFSLAEFSEPEKIIFYKTYLGQALFYNCDVSKVNFSSVEWRRRKGSRKWMVFEEEVNREAAPDLKLAEGADERHYWLIIELYQKLKKNYDERQDYGTAGDFHYGELEMKRLASRRRNKIVRWLVQHLRLVALYKYASQYGESYVRPGVLFVATLLLFASLYPVAGLRYEPKNDLGGNVSNIEPVILSYANPGQLGVGPIQARIKLFGSSCLTALEIAAFQKEPAYKPTHTWGRLLTLVEMLLTSTLAALFFLAVRRQFRR